MEDEVVVTRRSRRMTWDEAWWLALQPSEAAYETLLQSADTQSRRAFLWIAFASVTGMAVYYLASYAVKPFAIFTIIQPSGFIISPLFYVLGSTVAGPLGAALYAAIAHGLARMFGGKGSYTTLLYMLAASIAPITSATWIIRIFGLVLPGSGILVCLALVLTIYQLVLTAYAVHAAHQLNWTRTLTVVGIIVAVVVVIAVIVVIFATLSGFGLPN